MARRAFTLIELLVVLAIISMVLGLATVAVSGMLRTSRILGATDILRAAVSRTRASAIASRRSCTLDMSYTEEADTTERLTTSVILTMEDFERYSEDEVDFAERTPPGFGNSWRVWPVTIDDAWWIVADSTRELWAGRDIGPYGNGYAWNLDTLTNADETIDVETIVMARFRARRVTDANGVWGFGLVSNFDRTAGQGYRFAVRVTTEGDGWNFVSTANIEKLTDLNNSDDVATPPELDVARESAVITPGVWYRMRMAAGREDRIVTLRGMIWVEGTPEPVAWTVGPIYDIWGGVTPPAGITQEAAFGGSPYAGGHCGVWVQGAEVAVDDFSVDWREKWLLPKGIHLQAGIRDPATGVFTPVNPPDPGSFPLSWRPDGTGAADERVDIVVTDTVSGFRRNVWIDPNTGRVKSED